MSKTTTKAAPKVRARRKAAPRRLDGDSSPTKLRIPVLSGDSDDDAFALGAGTGAPISVSGGGGGGDGDGTVVTVTAADATITVNDADPANLTIKVATSAPILDAVLTGGTVSATPSADDNSLKLADTAYVDRAVPAAGTSAPVIDGTGAAGSSASYSRQDHVHPTDTSRAPLQPRVLQITANTATPAINVGSFDEVEITGQSTAITSMSSGLSGTPVRGQKMFMTIAATASVGITWGTSFESSGIATLPTETVSGKTITVFLRWNATASKWVCYAVDSTGF